MKQGFKSVRHDEHTDRVDIRLLRCESRTDLSVRYNELLHVVADKNIFLLLFPEDTVRPVDLKLICQRHTAVTVDLDLRVADRKDRSCDLLFL